MDLRGARALVTGASGGIGAATAELLAGQGMSVALVARRQDALEAVAARCGARAHALVADATRRDQVRRVVEETLARFGQIDVWINNVGLGISRPPSLLTDEDVDEMVRANIKSALYGMQEVLPHFKSRNAGQVINLSSLLGRMARPQSRSMCTAMGIMMWKFSSTTVFPYRLRASWRAVRATRRAPRSPSTSRSSA